MFTYLIHRSTISPDKNECVYVCEVCFSISPCEKLSLLWLRTGGVKWAYQSFAVWLNQTVDVPYHQHNELKKKAGL